MKILIVVTVIFIAFTLPALSCDIDLCTKTSESYKAFIKVNRDKDGYIENRSLFIKQHNKTIFSDVSFDYYSFGDYGEDSKQYVIKDLNKNGIPDLVTTTYTGGSRCCYILNIYELGPLLKRIFTIEANHHGYELKDLNHDGVFEILYRDPTLMCEGNEFYHCPTSAAGLVVFEWTEKGYKVSSRLMKKEPLKNYASNILDEGMFDVKFIQYMANMSYSGNMDLAFRRISNDWPKNNMDFHAFKKKFISLLNESPYWKEFQSELNH
jgi:hypothetical protein